MRGTLLAGLALGCLLAAACADPGDGTADDTTPADPTSAATSDSKSAPPSAEWTEVAIVHATAAGGTVSSTPVPVDSEAALDAFVAQFERPDLGEKVRSAVARADVPDGHVPAAAVVALGCDVPPGVSVVTDRELRVVPDKVASPLKECFAAVTSVAVLTLEESLLPSG
jgi:hypothetical protein